MMLTCARARTPFLPSLSLSSSSFSLKLLLHRLKPYHYHTSPIKMSATVQVVEHIVLFKVKPEVESSKVNAMVNGLNALTSLNLTVHLTAGPILQSRSSSLSFTHMLHSRYKSKQELSDYSVHPDHVSVVKDYIRPIIDDIMAVDWISNDLNCVFSVPKPGSSMRVTFVKLKENLGEDDKSRVLEVIGGIKHQFPLIDQISFGENFSLDRAKGYTIGLIAVLPGLSELDALDSNAELVNLQKEKVRDLIESVVVVDYVIQSPQAANL